jgi:hypothetical protein
MRNFTPRSEVCRQRWNLSPRVEVISQGCKPSVCLFFFSKEKDVFTPGGEQRGEYSPRDQSSPLGAKVIPGRKIYPMGVKLMLLKLDLTTHISADELTLEWTYVFVILWR